MQLEYQLNRFLRKASRVSRLPLMARWSPDQRAGFTTEQLEGFKASQTLALQGAEAVASMMSEGWTEQQAARLLETWLLDHGVKSFFHHPYAWFGERTRFAGINRRLYHQFMPTTQRLRADDPFILDVAPVLAGYTSDIGYTASLQPNAELIKAQNFLRELRTDIKTLFSSKRNGSEVWTDVDQKIIEAGYDNIHKLYPFSVLGHRLHQVSDRGVQWKLLNFGWHSYWSLGSRGIFGQLLNKTFEGPLDGLWAIEPHIGGPGFGAKFEEILLVKNGTAVWLADMEA